MLYVFLFCGLASSMSSRSLDPLVTLVARDFSVPVATAALISSAYAFPFALSQPVLGPLGDFYGKELVLKSCMIALALCLVGCAIAPEFETLLAFRLLSGVAAGGIMPVAMAIIGDRFAPAHRQLAIGRFLTSSQIGMVMGASLAGYMGVATGWRSFLWLAAVFTLACALLTLLYLKSPPRTRRGHISLSHALRNYAEIFANPKALVCFTTVFLEGMALFGALPFVGALLEGHGAGGAREAGFILGAMAAGGIVYSLILPLLLRRLRRPQMMVIGACAAVSGLVGMLLGLAWPVQAALFFATGFGFFMLHNSVHAEVADLSQTSRASAFSMHAFSFFLGQAIGPVVCGIGLGLAGQTWLVANVIVFAATGLVAARIFAGFAAAQSKS